MRYAILIVLTCLLSSCAVRVIANDCKPVLCETCDAIDDAQEYVCTVRR